MFWLITKERERSVTKKSVQKSLHCSETERDPKWRGPCVLHTEVLQSASAASGAVVVLCSFVHDQPTVTQFRSLQAKFNSWQCLKNVLGFFLCGRDPSVWLMFMTQITQSCDISLLKWRQCPRGCPAEWPPSSGSHADYLSSSAASPATLPPASVSCVWSVCSGTRLSPWWEWEKRGHFHISA